MTSIAEQAEQWQRRLESTNADDASDISLPEADTYCRRLATGHYENFPLVSCLLPKRLHQHFYNVYSFCRWADDLGDEIGDEIGDPTRSLELLAWWRRELAACFAGRVRHPVFVALRPTIERFNIPEQPFADLISAFEQDQTVCQYQTFPQLLDYCQRSANPVGRLVLFLCESVSDENVVWSDSICTGLQLANFWQDVARDLDIGRIYLPEEDRLRCGVTPEMLAARRSTPEFIALLEFEVQRARELLLSGLPLVSRLPGRLQIDIELFARGGLCILNRIQAAGYRVLERRPVVTKFDALRMLAACVTRAAYRKLSRS